MRIGICDDDKIWLKKADTIIKEYCQEHTLQAEILHFQNQEELLMSVQTLDLLFMDIDLENENGIHVVGEINTIYPDCFVVYLTNYLFYATDVYETKHDYFVLKEQFASKIDSIMNLYDRSRKIHHDKISITSMDKTTGVVPVKQILYLERSARTTKIVTKDGIYVVKEKIEEMEKELSAYEFIRSHKSFLVNPWHVRECRKNGFIIEDDQEIPISRRFEKNSREGFLTWAASHLL